MPIYKDVSSLELVTVRCICSMCETEYTKMSLFNVSINFANRPDYCPTCGAKMDGKENRKNSYFNYEKVFTKTDPEKLSRALYSKITYVLVYPKEVFLYSGGVLIYSVKEIDFMSTKAGMDTVVKILESLTVKQKMKQLSIRSM